MKYYNLEHSTTIYVDQSPESKSPQEGQLESHTQRASMIEYFQPCYLGNSEPTYVKVGISRDMILELADQIRKIESEVIIKEYENLPF